MSTLIWDDEKRGIRWLVGYLLAAIPMLVIAYPFLIWPVLYGVKVDGDLFNDLSAAAPQSSGNDLLNRIYFPMLMVLTFVLVTIQGIRPSAAIRHRLLLLITVLIGFFLLSSLWSGAASVTIKRTLLQCFIIYSVVIACITTSRPEKILHYLYVFHAFLMIINIFIVLLEPAGPLGHEGIYPQKNYLGQCAGVAGLFILYKIATGQGFDRLLAIFMLVVTIIVLVASRSKTSIGLFFLVPLLGLGVTYVVYYLRIAAGLFIGVAVLALFLIFSLGEAADIWTFGTIANAIFGDPTLTSRTYIWEFTSDMIAQKPWLGYGFGAFWSTGVDSVSFREAPGFIKKLNHAHNGYIDILLQIGWLGFALFLTLLVTIGNMYGRATTHNFIFGWFAITCFIYLLCQNFFETTFFFGFEGMSVLMITNLMLAIRLAHENRTARVQ